MTKPVLMMKPEVIKSAEQQIVGDTNGTYAFPKWSCEAAILHLASLHAAGKATVSEFVLSLATWIKDTGELTPAQLKSFQKGNAKYKASLLKHAHVLEAEGFPLDVLKDQALPYPKNWHKLKGTVPAELLGVDLAQSAGKGKVSDVVVTPGVTKYQVSEEQFAELEPVLDEGAAKYGNGKSEPHKIASPEVEVIFKAELVGENEDAVFLKVHGKSPKVQTHILKKNVRMVDQDFWAVPVEKALILDIKPYVGNFD